MSLFSNIVDAIKKAFKHKTLEELTDELDAKAAKLPDNLDWRNSVVDLLKTTGQDSSLAARKAMAVRLGYHGKADGSADMNNWLHQKVMDQLRWP